MAIATIALGEVVMDFAIYPRSRTSSVHVSRMVEALEAGRKLPAPILDKRSKRVVDGWHRIRAYQRTLEPTDKIKVDLREYPDEATLLRDAIRLNAEHGRPLSPFDRARSISLAESLGISEQEIASDLGVVVSKIKTVREATLAYDPQQKPVVLKRGIASYLRGQTLTTEQVEANEHLDGMTAYYHLRWLTRAISNDMVEWTEQVIEESRRLLELMEEHV